MRRLRDMTGERFGRLVALKATPRPGHRYVCRCDCGAKVIVSATNLVSLHTQSCGCYNKQRLSEVHTGHKYNVGRPAANRIDRTGKRYGKLVVLKQLSSYKWLCRCACGNEVIIHSTNLRPDEYGSKGCRHCSNRKDITGETVGYLTAVSTERGALVGREPLWTFKCRCGNTIQGTVREFHAQWLRSCGCMDNANASWGCMMSRCYNRKDPRYNSYGGRGIKVCKRWHKFSNFIADMGERPKRHNLGRKHAEKDYSKSNCIWEHVSLNCRDTNNDGTPTKPGLRKGAKHRTEGESKRAAKKEEE